MPGTAWLNIMVSYQTATAIAFEIAKQELAEIGQEVASEIVSVVADVWDDRKQELQEATRQKAEEILREEITF